MKNNVIIQGYIQGNKFGETLGMDFEIPEIGTAIYKIKIVPEHLATATTAHGGVLAAFSDAVLGVGALSLSSTFNNVVATVEFKISYLKPALLGDVLIGTSTVLKSGKSLIFMEARIVNQRNELVCTANGTFNQYPMEKLMSITI